MEEILKKVAEFQRAFGQLNNKFPTMIPFEVEELRFKLMEEENKEYWDADTLVEKLDACVDMMYILAGTINAHGFQEIFMEAFDRVHKNNMGKLGADGKPIYNEMGKVIKPEGFIPVGLEDLISFPLI